MWQAALYVTFVKVVLNHYCNKEKTLNMLSFKDLLDHQKKQKLYNRTTVSMQKLLYIKTFVWRRAHKQSRTGKQITCQIYFRYRMLMKRVQCLEQEAGQSYVSRWNKPRTCCSLSYLCTQIVRNGVQKFLNVLPPMVKSDDLRGSSCTLRTEKASHYLEIDHGFKICKWFRKRPSPKKSNEYLKSGIAKTTDFLLSYDKAANLFAKLTRVIKKFCANKYKRTFLPFRMLKPQLKKGCMLRQHGAARRSRRPRERLLCLEDDSITAATVVVVLAVLISNLYVEMHFMYISHNSAINMHQVNDTKNFIKYT